VKKIVFTSINDFIKPSFGGFGRPDSNMIREFCIGWWGLGSELMEPKGLIIGY
jgi:hypothetical protein